MNTDPVTAALRELVALKALDEEIEHARQSGDAEARDWAVQARDDYKRRKPLAWDAARAALAAPMAAPEPLCVKCGERHSLPTAHCDYVHVPTLVDWLGEQLPAAPMVASAAPEQSEETKYDSWRVLGRFFKFWIGSALYDGSGAEVDLEEPYEAFRAVHAQATRPTSQQLLRDIFAEIGIAMEAHAGHASSFVSDVLVVPLTDFNHEFGAAMRRRGVLPDGDDEPASPQAASAPLAERDIAFALRCHIKTFRLAGRNDGMVEDMELAAAALAARASLPQAVELPDPLLTMDRMIGMWQATPYRGVIPGGFARALERACRSAITPVGEIVIGPKGDVEGWTVVKWFAERGCPPVGTRLYVTTPPPEEARPGAETGKG